MKVNGKSHRTIWLADDGVAVEIIDQTELPHSFVIRRLANMKQAAEAIAVMQVRGAPLIGATAAYGVALMMHADSSDAALEGAYDTLLATRPTAINLRWGLDRMVGVLRSAPAAERVALAYREAAAICDEDVAICEAIGDHGLGIIERRYQEVGRPQRFNILTHCNAGWLATVDWGTALAPVYKAHNAGLPVHVWVDETRPRNQGASLTAWELASHGVPHTVIVDNAGGHLMQHGMVHMCIVGTDRTTRTGDVCNKIGTYLKALAAFDNDVPFYVGLPSPTLDWQLSDGVKEIPIEERDADEVHEITRQGVTVRLTPQASGAANYGFDVTPARLVTALITERGVCPATAAGLAGLFPEQAQR